MSNELIRWASGQPSMLSRADREHARAVADVVRKTKLAGVGIDAEAALAGRIMERTCDLDAYRKSLANGDPVLDAVLTRVEVNYVDKASRRQRSFGSEFPV